MASTKQAEQHLTADQGNGERDANATGAGRKVLCNADLTGGVKCKLWKGHEGDHDSLIFNDDDFAVATLDADEIAQLNVAERDPAQLKIDALVADNFIKWTAKGSDMKAPLWQAFTVPAVKVHKLRTMLRSAADAHNPPVQVRIDDKFEQGGNIRVAWAAVTRREYKPRAK